MDIKSLYDRFRKSGKVSTDTRQITPGSVFFALKGPTFDANAFAQDALAKGAMFAVVDDAKFAKGDKTIFVPDGLKALQQLARYHRDQLRIPFIGLTGSNGKTTTKELIYAVLSKKFKTLATTGNLNNHIGVPLTVLSVDSSIEVAVIEMGANHVGEIAMLSEIANPTHGLITNIGKGHIGTFGGFENIIRGKSELYQHLIQHKGEVFINSKNPILFNMAKRFSAPFFYPSKGDYYHAELRGADPFVELEADNGDHIKTQLTGSYNFENIVAALCVGKFFGVPAITANQAVSTYVPGNMRSQILQTSTNTIVLDAYNANPSSMEAAIDNLSQMSAAKKVAILGDMYELGDDSEVEHRRVGELLVQKGIKEVWLCGDLMRAAAESMPAASWFKNKDELIAALKKNPIRNATILVKASRGMKLETIVDFLE